MSQVKSSHPQKIEVLESSRVKSWFQSSHFQRKSSQVPALPQSSPSRVSSHQSFSSQVQSQSLFWVKSLDKSSRSLDITLKIFNLILHQFIEKDFYISPWLHFNIVSICNVFLDIFDLCCRIIKTLWEKILSASDDVGGTVKTIFCNWFNTLYLIPHLWRTIWKINITLWNVFTHIKS